MGLIFPVVSVAVAGALHYAHRIVARPMGSGGRVDQNKSLDNIMSVTRYILVMMMMTTLLGMALGCLLAWCCCCPRPCVDAVRPRPCVDAGHDAGTLLVDVTPNVVASSLSAVASSSSAPAAPLPVGTTCGWVSDGGRRLHRREDCSGLRFSRNIKKVDACKICG